MSQETPTVSLDENPDDELQEIVKKGRKDVRREKFDLSSARVVLDKFLRESLVKPDDTVAHLRMVIEEEFKRIEDI